jgi:hypothetical protein
MREKLWTIPDSLKWSDGDLWSCCTGAFCVIDIHSREDGWAFTVRESGYRESGFQLREDAKVAASRWNRSRLSSALLEATPRSLTADDLKDVRDLLDGWASGQNSGEDFEGTVEVLKDIFNPFPEPMKVRRMNLETLEIGPPEEIARILTESDREKQTPTPEERAS